MNAESDKYIDEYLDDDLIKLNDIEQQRLNVLKLNLSDINSVVFKRTPTSKETAVEEQVSAYGRKSFELPVTFFDYTNNIKLLNECRPLSIQVVDCDKHPWYYKNYLRHEFNTHENSTDSHESIIYVSPTVVTSDINENIILLDDEIEANMSLNGLKKEISKGETNDFCITNLNNKQNISKEIMNKKSGEKVALENKLTPKDISKIDFKRNKGLIGLKIIHKVIVDDVEQKNLSNVEMKEKFSSEAGNIKANNNQKENPRKHNVISNKDKQKEINKDQNGNKIEDITSNINKAVKQNVKCVHNDKRGESKIVSESKSPKKHTVLKSICRHQDISHVKDSSNVNKNNKDKTQNKCNDIENSLRLIFGMSESTNHSSFKSTLNSSDKNGSVSDHLNNKNGTILHYPEQRVNATKTEHKNKTSSSNKTMTPSENCKVHSEKNNKGGSSFPVFPCNIITNKNKTLKPMIPKHHTSMINKMHSEIESNKTVCGSKSQLIDKNHVNNIVDNVPKLKNVRKKNNDLSKKSNRKTTCKEVSQPVNEPTENRVLSSQQVQNHSTPSNESTHAVININRHVTTSASNEPVSQHHNKMSVLSDKLSKAKENCVHKNNKFSVHTNQPVPQKESYLNECAAQPLTHRSYSNNPIISKILQRKNEVMNKSTNFGYFPLKRPPNKKTTFIRPYKSQTKLNQSLNSGHQIPTLIQHRSERPTLWDTSRNVSRLMYQNPPDQNYMTQPPIECNTTNVNDINMGIHTETNFIYRNENAFWSHLAPGYQSQQMHVAPQHLPQYPPIRPVPSQMSLRNVLPVPPPPPPPPPPELSTQEVRPETLSHNVSFPPSYPMQYKPGYNNFLPLVPSIASQSSTFTQRVNIVVVPVSADNGPQTNDNEKNIVIKTEPKTDYEDTPINSKKEMLEELAKIIDKDIMDDENVRSFILPNICAKSKSYTTPLPRNRSNCRALDTISNDKTDAVKAMRTEIVPDANAGKEVVSTESKRNSSTNKVSKQPMIGKKPGPLSKTCNTLPVKIQADQCNTPPPGIERVCKGYSPPILPIPTYQKTLEILAQTNSTSKTPLKKEVCSDMTKEKSLWELNNKGFEFKFGQKSEALKKISLNDYMKRTKNNDRYDRDEPRKKIQKAHSHVNSSHYKKAKYGNRYSDNLQDLGYDSDTTVKL